MNLIINLYRNFEIFGNNGHHWFRNTSEKKRIEWFIMSVVFRIQTNIWLSTSRANISWPVTINFVWPSVLTQKSSAATIDFQMTFINTTKVISSSSSSLIFLYSIFVDPKCDNNESFVRFSDLFCDTSQ